MRRWLNQLLPVVPGLIVVVSLTTIAHTADAGVFAWLRDRREAELESTVARRVRHEISLRMTAVRHELGDRLGLQFADETSRLEAQVDEAVKQAAAELEQQHANELAEMQEAFAGEAESLRRQVDQQFAKAERRLARRTAADISSAEKSMQLRLDGQFDKAEGRLERRAAEDLSRMAAAHEVRIERAIERSTELLDRQIERKVQRELASATQRFERRIEERLAQAAAAEEALPEPGGPGKKRHRRDPDDSKEPGTTRIELPVAPEPVPFAPTPPEVAGW